MIDDQNYVFQNFKIHEAFNVIFLFKLLNTFFSNSVFISKKRKMYHSAFTSFLIYWKKRVTNQNEIHWYRGNKIINNATVITINRRSISYIAHLSNKSHDFIKSAKWYQTQNILTFKYCKTKKIAAYVFWGTRKCQYIGANTSIALTFYLKINEIKCSWF